MATKKPPKAHDVRKKIYVAHKTFGLPDIDEQEGKDAIARLLGANVEKPDSYTAQAWVSAAVGTWNVASATHSQQRKGGTSSAQSRAKRAADEAFSILKRAEQLHKRVGLAKAEISKRISREGFVLLDSQTEKPISDPEGQEITVRRSVPTIRGALQRSDFLPPKRKRTQSKR